MDKTTPMKAKPLVNVTCKLGVKGCFEDGRCHALGNCENKIKTNGDKIRSMDDAELAEFLNMVSNDSMDTITGYGTKDYSVTWENQRDTMKWLKSEAE
jgi:hypothetical protein